MRMPAAGEERMVDKVIPSSKFFNWTSHWSVQFSLTLFLNLEVNVRRGKDRYR